jgi:hypothetical protein
LGDFFLNPQVFQALRQNQRKLIRRGKIKVQKIQSLLNLIN